MMLPLQHFTIYTAFALFDSGNNPKHVSGTFMSVAMLTTSSGVAHLLRCRAPGSSHGWRLAVPLPRERCVKLKV